jgi:predicted transcriptional regulator
MSSESRPQPAPGPQRRPRQAADAAAWQPDPDRDNAFAAAELAGVLGYDPDDPATWPGNRPAVPAEPGPAVAPEANADAPVELTDARAMRAVAHPVRMALIELFNFRETLTATQASEALGESPANCAFHLRTLAKYGFVHEAGGGKGRERPWALVNRTVTLSTEQADPQAASAAVELARHYFERWVERARRVFGAGHGNQVPGWDEASGWSGNHVFLTADEAIRIRGEMSKLLKPYEARLANPALRPGGALPVEWALFCMPIPEAADPGAAAGPQARDSAARNATDE